LLQVARGRTASPEDLREEETMPRPPNPDLPPELRALGLEEVERRLEASPLVAAAGAEPAILDGHATSSCCCKIGDDPPEPDEPDPDGI
jgi:hypothetical protein